MKRGTPDHPKMRRLMQLLNCGQVVAVGTLELLWHWTARYAPQGDIGRWSPEHIAAGIGWEGSPENLVEALVEAGWACRARRSHLLLIHDWPDHAEDAVKKYISRNNLTFFNCRELSRHVGTMSRHVTPAVAVAVAVASAITDNPPYPPAPGTFPQASAENGNGNETPPQPPARAGGASVSKPRERDDERVARHIREWWHLPGPLSRVHIRRIRVALKSTPADELIATLKGDDAPDWLVPARGPL